MDCPRTLLAERVVTQREVTAYALAAYAGLWLCPRMGGPAVLMERTCYYDSTTSLARQAHDICAVIALACYPCEPEQRLRLHRSLLALCLQSLDLSAWTLTL